MSLGKRRFWRPCAPSTLTNSSSFQERLKKERKNCYFSFPFNYDVASVKDYCVTVDRLTVHTYSRQLITNRTV